MLTKYCTGCKETKPEIAFHRKGTKRQSQCKRCRAVHSAHYYINNTAEQKQRVKKNKKAVKAEARKIIVKAKAVPCGDCRRSYPSYVMDFDHVRGTKRREVSALAGCYYGLNVLKEEIEKCEVVCSNCHRERTFGKAKKK